MSEDVKNIANSKLLTTEMIEHEEDLGNQKDKDCCHIELHQI